MKQELKISRKILDSRGFPPRLITEYHAFVWQLLKEPEKCSWGNEIKIARELFEIFPDMQFWSTLNLGFYLRSLAWLKSASGLAKLYESIEKWKHDKKINFQEPTPTTYDDKKHGEDLPRDTQKAASPFERLINHGKKTKPS